MNTSNTNVNNAIDKNESELRQRIDSLIFGYFQRTGYSKCVESLTLESTYLASDMRKHFSGGQTVISINDRVHDKILEEIILLFIQDGRFDVSRELLEVGESLREVVNRFTTLTTLPSVNKSDMHQKLYGRASVSRHSQSVGYVAQNLENMQRNRNFRPYTLQPAPVARAQMNHQLIIQQAEQRYQQQQEHQRQQRQIQEQQQKLQEEQHRQLLMQQQEEVQKMPNEMDSYQVKQRQYEHSRERQIQLQERLDPNLDSGIMNQNANSSNYYSKQDASTTVAKQSNSSSSEGSARRKLHAPQSLNSKMQETLIDPLVGIINERPWDSVSDINIEEFHGIDNLDVIGKDFLAAFDYLPEREEESRLGENFGVIGGMNTVDQFEIAGMRVESEVIVDSCPPQEVVNNVESEKQPQSSTTPRLEVLHDSLKINMPTTIAMPEPLISPIETSSVSSRDTNFEKPKKINIKEDRHSTSSEFSSIDDDRSKNKGDQSSKSNKNDQRRSDRTESASRDKDSKRRHGNDDRRDHRRSSSPTVERKRSEKSSRYSEIAPTSKDDARQSLKRARDRSSDKRNKRIRDDATPSNKADKKDDGHTSEKTKQSKTNEKESRESRKYSKPSTESEKKSDTKKLSEARKSSKIESVKDSTPVRDSAAKMKNSLMNKLRMQKKNESASSPIENKKSNNSGFLLDNIGKEMNAFSSKTADEISIQHKKKTDYRIPKKSSIPVDPIPPSMTPTQSVYSPSSSRTNLIVESPKESETVKETETKESPVVDKKSDDEGPLCEGDEREDTTAFISPKLTVLRLAAMLVNADKKYGNAQRKDRVRSSQSQSYEDTNVLDSEDGMQTAKVNAHPKSAKYAPQKVNSYMTKENKNDSSDSENEKESSREDGELHSPKCDETKGLYRKSINLTKASEMLDLLHANSE